jgi:hypothetical protein
MTATTFRATCVLCEHGKRWVLVDPWPQFEVELLKKHNILRVVLTHDFPASLVIPHTASPEFMASVTYFLSQADELADIIEFVADESEFGFVDAGTWNDGF